MAVQQPVYCQQRGVLVTHNNLSQAKCHAVTYLLPAIVHCLVLILQKTKKKKEEEELPSDYHVSSQAFYPPYLYHTPGCYVVVAEVVVDMTSHHFVATKSYYVVRCAAYFPLPVAYPFVLHVPELSMNVLSPQVRVYPSDGCFRCCCRCFCICCLTS